MWNPRILKILCFLIFCSTTDGYNSTTIERISFLLEQFCPYDGICLSNHTETNLPDSDRHYSCCSVCSCDDTCQYTKTCCFPKMSRENDVPPVLKSPESHKTCLYPFTTNTEFQRDQRMEFISYFMITSEDGATPYEACGNKTVASWGSMYPVYSKQKDMLFKNPICATAYGADDGVLWTPFLSCNTYVKKSDFASDGATFSLSPGVNYIPDDCSVFFKYPGDDIGSHVCYNDEEFIDTCKYSEYSLPAHVEQYKDEITFACTSGLISPYKLGGMYANVFCYICNLRKFDERDTCKKGIVRTLANMHGFVGLLNIGILQFDERRTKKRNFQLACRRSNIQDASCREINCSSGKSRDFDGNCHFSTKYWFTLVYNVLVSLTSADDIDIDHLFVPERELEALKRTNAFVYSISHLKTQNSAVSKNLLVVITLSFDNGIDPNSLITIIYKMIRRQWRVFSGDEQISLQADFGKVKYTLYYLSESNFPTEMTFRDSDNSSHTLNLPAFREIYKDQSILPARAPAFFITKMYYCQQVDLSNSEFILSKIGELYVLYNKLTDQYLFDGEFTLTNKNGVVTPMVCLESSGLVVSSGHGNCCHDVFMALGSMMSITIWHFMIG